MSTRVIRLSGRAAALVWVAPLAAFAELPAAVAGPPAAVAEPPAAVAEPPAEVRQVGAHQQPRAVFTARPKRMKLTVPLSMAVRGEAITGFPADAQGTEYAPDPALNAELRVGLTFSTADAWSLLLLEAQYEQDVQSGIVLGGARDFEGLDPPSAPERNHALRKAFGRVGFGPFLTLTGGYDTSHWGLGLLANDGAHGDEPGSARFADPRGGDRSLRAAVATGPWTSGRLLLQVAYDQVEGDDSLLTDDEATQMVAAAILGFRRPRTLGVYGARRHQKTGDGRKTDVTALDAYGRWEQRLGGLTLTGAFEAAYLTGTTELSPTPEHVRHDLQQLGVAARVGLDAGALGTVVDFLYASGDQNLDDGDLNAFKPDPNYEMGLFLYRHVLAATTSRAPVNAADPDLVGRPAPDLERVPTRGSASNTVAFFPRAWWRPADGLEVFGGPLLAFAAARPVDPRNTRLAGGDPHNAYDGAPGSYLGTELDLGVRYRMLLDGVVFSAGLEGGVFLPGSAFEDADGQTLDPVGGSRATLRLAF